MDGQQERTVTSKMHNLVDTAANHESRAYRTARPNQPTQVTQTGTESYIHTNYDLIEGRELSL